MFGISAAQVGEFYSELRRVHGSDVTETDYRHVQSSLGICSLNCTWEQLYDVQRAWLPPDAPLISVRTLRDDFTRVAQLYRSPLLMNPELQFTQGVSWLSDVICMLDVTTIPCRARKPRETPDDTTRDSTYSGKHRQHCFKVEVLANSDRSSIFLSRTSCWQHV